MSEIFLSLLVAVFIGIFYWRQFGNYRYGALFCLWCWLGPDLPKLFVSNGYLVDLVSWYLVIAISLLLLGNRFNKSFLEKKYLNFILFLNLGLVLHLMIDFLFSVA